MYYVDMIKSCIFDQTLHCTCMYWMSARHQGPSCWGTNRGHIVIVQDNSFIRQGINVGGRYLVRTMKTYVIPALEKKEQSDLGLHGLLNLGSFWYDKIQIEGYILFKSCCKKNISKVYKRNKNANIRCH